MMNRQVGEAIRYWPRVAPVLEPPRSKSDYRHLVEALDTVLDNGGADESSPLARLADYLGDLVADYEAVHVPIKEMPAREFLRELMNLHGLNQSDLPEVGAQSVVSDVMRGKRELNTHQIARLSKRFGLPADVFIE